MDGSDVILAEALRSEGTAMTAIRAAVGKRSASASPAWTTATPLRGSGLPGEAQRFRFVLSAVSTMSAAHWPH